jgi:bifunctional non-homologous end joining protein LigD
MSMLPRGYTRDARWVRPELTGDVEYRSHTVDRTGGAGLPRHPSWKGLRPDKSIADLL